MNDFVAIETNMCLVCGEIHTHNTGILIDKRLKPIKNTLLNYGLCEQHDKLYKDGFIALVEVENDHDGEPNQGLHPENAKRTGRIIHLKSKIADDMFNNGVTTNQEIAFIPKEVFEMLEDMHENAKSD